MSTSLPVEKNQIFTVHILNSHIITDHDEGKPEYHSLLALHCFFSAWYILVLQMAHLLKIT